ncbi:MAG: TolC family protein [Thermoanaerobaculaceae bacterium]|nr:TolC family protein [Thermoanaerobaculaceae bacterium]
MPAPPVEELIAEALDRAPALEALRSRLAAARELIAPAGALPDPMVEIVLQDMSFPRWTVGSDQMSMIGPEVRQDLPWPGKREARREAARAAVASRGADVEQLRRQVAMQVRTLYARVFALDRERAYLEAAREMLDMLAATAASRYSAGEDNQEPVLKAQLETSRLGERTDDLAAERATLVAALDRLLDRDGGRQLGEVASLPAVSPPPPPWEALAVAGSPEVAVRRAEVAAAERRAAVARLDLKPDLTAGAALGLRGRFDPAVTLSVGMTLPLWRKEKQAPLARAADLETAAARSDLRDAEAQARAEAARLAAEWDRAGRQVERYRQAIVPQTSATVDAARAAYLTGRGDFLTVVDDFNRWLDARVQLAAREADRYSAWAQFQALAGSTEKEN